MSLAQGSSNDAAQGEEHHDMCKCEWFVTGGDDLALWEYWLSPDELAVGDRQFKGKTEWDDFVKAVRDGEAVARAHKQFPYTAGREAPGWEVEREYWFEWLDSSQTMRYVVVHAHSMTKWSDRKTSGDGVEFIGHVNVRHCTSNRDFAENPSNSIQADTERSGFCVRAFPGDGLAWREVADADANQDIRDVIDSGEGTHNFIKAAHRGADCALSRMRSC